MMVAAAHRRCAAARRTGWRRAAALGWRAAVPVLALVLTGVLAGCKEEKAAPAAPSGTAHAAAVDAAEQALRVAYPGAGVRFRGVQAYAQAVAGRVAVCGQVNPFRDDTASFVPFVSVVVPGTSPVVDAATQHVATTPSEASHVWLAIVGYCYEQGGPAPGERGVMSLPPMPEVAADAPQAPSAPVAARPLPRPAAIAQAGASGGVTMRQNANLHADPHGPVSRVVPSGTSLQVLSEAAGGWLQVGQDGSAWGWVHESMVERH